MNVMRLLEERLARYEHLSEQISSLYYVDEQSIMILEELQEQQLEMWQEIMGLRERVQEPFSPLVVKTINHCIELERISIQKMQEFQGKLSVEMKQMQNTHLTRRYYQDAYTQTEGYFFDKQR
ncbi:hypothetical protein [Paenibacillus sp. y28]|uniref:hypothetical protein n=1 Tax=Paenibacillus sp. y28 TaxID=3129110 RepID=UPI003016AEF3